MQCAIRVSCPPQQGQSELGILRETEPCVEVTPDLSHSCSWIPQGFPGSIFSVGFEFSVPCCNCLGVEQQRGAEPPLAGNRSSRSSSSPSAASKAVLSRNWCRREEKPVPQGNLPLILCPGEALQALVAKAFVSASSNAAA